MSTNRLIVMILVFISIFILPSSAQAGGAKTTWVNAYTKKDGTYVSSHWRSPPSSSLGGVYVGSYIGSACYIPDYSMNKDGLSRFTYNQSITKEGLDLSKCSLSALRSKVSECEGFSVVVTNDVDGTDGGLSTVLKLDNVHDPLSSYCTNSSMTNLPGGATVVCKAYGGSWTLAISPLPVCTDGDETPLPPEKIQENLGVSTPADTDIQIKDDPIDSNQQDVEDSSEVSNDLKEDKAEFPARQHDLLYAAIPAIVFLALLSINL